MQVCKIKQVGERSHGKVVERKIKFGDESDLQNRAVDSLDCSERAWTRKHVVRNVQIRSIWSRHQPKRHGPRNQVVLHRNHGRARKTRDDGRNPSQLKTKKKKKIQTRNNPKTLLSSKMRMLKYAHLKMESGSLPEILFDLKFSEYTKGRFDNNRSKVPLKSFSARSSMSVVLGNEGISPLSPLLDR